MSKLLANGQLPSSKGTLFTATGPDVVNINVANSSGSNTETVILYVSRNAGTDRILRQVILNPNESAFLAGLPIESGDLIKGQTTDATTVDYDITGLGQAATVATPPPPMEFATFDANGNLKSLTTNTALSSSPTAGIGYTTGAGGTVTQATSRTTGVTLNKTTGQITLVSAAGSATPASFTLTNSAIGANDVVIINQKSGTDLYEIFVTNIAAGSCKITSFTTGGTTTEQPVFTFAVIKGASA
jgi:hypothetical protein